ncbi:MAG TPA: DUF3109 family protein [Balneolales bacterium]|nr:DUF3109 family protein [Balneolales bacterium]
MFQIQNVLLSDDIPFVKFACDLPRCKGACCVVGDAGAPVTREEIPILRKAFRELKDELRARAREVADNEGIIRDANTDDPEINCTDGEECIFVKYDENGIANCAIQQAYDEGRFPWMKPLSCHLFPLRVQTIGGMDFVNYQYIPSLCSAACSRGKKEGIYLSDFLKDALIRRYGHEWYDEFEAACEHIRTRKSATA